MQTDTLTPAEFEKARALIARMAAPLTADEKRACELTGVTEEAFREERNLELRNQLPGKKTALTADEQHVARLMGMSNEQLAQAKLEERTGA